MDFQQQQGGDRVWHQANDADGCAGNWTCASCNKTIDRLPFKPREGGTNTLKCKDCFKASRPSGGFGR